MYKISFMFESNVICVTSIFTSLSLIVFLLLGCKIKGFIVLFPLTCGGRCLPTFKLHRHVQMLFDLQLLIINPWLEHGGDV